VGQSAANVNIPEPVCCGEAVGIMNYPLTSEEKAEHI